jgi:hypothetical protein
MLLLLWVAMLGPSAATQQPSTAVFVLRAFPDNEKGLKQLMQEMLGARQRGDSALGA